MIWRNILKEREHNTTYRVKRELVAVAFALYQHCCCECGRIRASRSCRLPDPTYELIKWCDLHATGSESSSGGMDARIAAMGVKSYSDFIFLALAYEGGWPVRSLTVFPLTVHGQCSLLIIAELARGRLRFPN